MGDSFIILLKMFAMHPFLHSAWTWNPVLRSFVCYRVLLQAR